jgi:peroxiredoxin
MYRFALTIALTLALAVACQAAETLPVVGKAKPNWAKLPGVDGKEHSLADLKQDVIVVAVTCNHCPIAIEYYERMKEFAAKNAGSEKVAVVAISVSDWETDLMPQMKEMAAKKGFNFAYLHDESQKVGKELGATNTPQFFVLNRERVMMYRGPWDDDINPSRVSKRYVEDAVAALLAGKSPVVGEKRPRGCLIDYRK